MWTVHRLGRVGSTNDEAARLAREGAPHGTVVVAEEQSQGRGTKGRTWWSPRGGLYLSAVLRLDVPPAALPPLTLAAGVGVCDACRALGAAAFLKWPNDVLDATSGGKKLAGILVEAATRGERVDVAIVGVGLNAGGATPPPELALTALSASVDEVLAVLVPSLERAVARFVDEGTAAVVRAFKERCPFLGRPIRVRDGETFLSGIMVDVDDEGALILEVEGARRRIVSGEVLP